MKNLLRRLAFLPLAFLSFSASTAEGPGFTYQAYTSPIVYGENFTFYFSLRNTGTVSITFTSYCFTLTRCSAAGRIETVHKTQSEDAQMPFTCLPKGDNFVLDLSIYPKGVAETEKFALDFVLNGRRGMSTVQIALHQDSPYAIGEAYHTSENPKVITSDYVYDPHRSAFDFSLSQTGTTGKISSTFAYEFSGFEKTNGQFLKPFLLSVKKRRKESGTYKQVSGQEAKLTIFGHANEYEDAAEQTLRSNKQSIFSLLAGFAQGELSFLLQPKCYLDRGTGRMSKRQENAKRDLETNVAVMPIGVSEANTYYPCMVTFKMDDDYFSLNTYQSNEHIGVGGSDSNYFIAVGGQA